MSEEEYPGQRYQASHPHDDLPSQWDASCNGFVFAMSAHDDTQPDHAPFFFSHQHVQVAMNTISTTGRHVTCDYPDSRYKPENDSVQVVQLEVVHNEDSLQTVVSESDTFVSSFLSDDERSSPQKRQRAPRGAGVRAPLRQQHQPKQHKERTVMTSQPASSSSQSQQSSPKKSKSEEKEKEKEKENDPEVEIRRLLQKQEAQYRGEILARIICELDSKSRDVCLKKMPKEHLEHFARVFFLGTKQAYFCLNHRGRSKKVIAFPGGNGTEKRSVKEKVDSFVWAIWHCKQHYQGILPVALDKISQGVTEGVAALDNM